MRSVCKGCETRYLGCHDKCETYLDAKREAEELKELKNKETATLCVWAKGIRTCKRKRGKK